MKIVSLDTYILENKIADLRDEIQIKIEVDTTVHAEERKFRHVESGEDPITNDDILLTTEKALDEICERQLKGFDKLGKKYWIYDKNNKDLNVVATLSRKDNDLILLVITIMREKEFRGSPDAFKINV
jgi:hypothetical protein